MPALGSQCTLFRAVCETDKQTVICGTLTSACNLDRVLCTHPVILLHAASSFSPELNNALSLSPPDTHSTHPGVDCEPRPPPSLDHNAASAAEATFPVRAATDCSPPKKQLTQP